MNRQPKAGEWWFSPNGTERAFCIGRDTTGDPIWEETLGDYSRIVFPDYVHVPDCDSWDWELPAMPIGWELCNPPKDAVECTFLRVWEDDTWHWCSTAFVNASEYIYCRRTKTADPGPQKEPSSVARIAAQLRQLADELEELEVSDGVD